MPVARTELELKLLNALRRIAAYDKPDRMRKHALNDWGCDFEEAIEMAYENIQEEAKRAARGVRVAKQPQTEGKQGGETTKLRPRSAKSG